MDELGLRLAILAKLLVPFLFMMASVYLLLHMIFARLITSPGSQVMWFFSVVTGPLVRPVRAVVPAGTSEARLRAIALAAYVGLWIVTDKILKALVVTPAG